ncbi:hypothetical protein U14_03701 [Candidatus Moduliflexus flocculans]|uniref:Ribosomal RNA small subunit methyltransferase E n=1 Tax=Candidatus Moduliflexus flocculans TaxID=1499966 RepID=A0A081BPY4_9BACT|nr:hypothetical protein U14_03701 [Candidatus Moduliflexus flocculans]
MSTHRFFVPPPQIRDGEVCLRGSDVWHITKVLRLGMGSEVVVFDGRGHEYRVVLERTKRQEIWGRIEDQWEKQTESPLKLSLVQGMPKGEKLDLIMQKATEIGMFELIPLASERSHWASISSQMSAAKAHQRLERLSRIGIEAAKQSCRSSVPFIRPIVTVEEFLAAPPNADLKLLLWEEEQGRRLKETLRAVAQPIVSAVVVIGPEGGLTPEEARRFQENGFLSVSLGQRILRTETAGIAVLSILQYEFGDY